MEFVSRSRRRRVRVAAWSLAGFTVLELVAMLVLLGMNASVVDTGQMVANVIFAVAVGVCAGVGLLIASRLPGIAIGWLLSMIGLSLAGSYRLYEIDRTISRTLAYAIVTGLLIGVYAGLVLLSTQVLTIKSPVAVAASTLTAAALFHPLRRRVQQLVDQRFNRARYDAEQTVAAFAAGLKDAVDLDSIRDDLAGAVDQVRWTPDIRL